MTQEKSFLSKLHDPKRFEKLEDGWIRDSLLGLDWGLLSEEIMNFEEAQEYCKKLGGRLPESYELISLIDHSKKQPACLLDDMKHDDWYWTGTTVAGNSGGAWCVGFYYGGVNVLRKVFVNYVRPVRASK